jgi:N-methylhydantoinase A
MPANPTAWRVGVDSGGTFTDVALVEDATGEVRVWKVPSTPDDPSRAIVEGVLEGLAKEAGGAPPSAVAYLGHGTTVATNALIQHRGARTGLVTTAGFRDLLEIARQRRPHLYDLQTDKPPVLVSRDLRLEVPERLRWDGSVEVPLDEAAVRGAARALRAAAVDAAAVCFLYSFVDPAHEEAAWRILEEELPGAFVCASHAVAPEFREYERLSTTVMNAYLGPVMRRYFLGLRARLRTEGFAAAPHITQSNGGVLSLEAAASQPVRTLLSGPATGVVGAARTGLAAGFADLVTFDMGGTSTDVALVQGGKAAEAGRQEIHGYPLLTPMLDIHTVGAGGGSIAAIDAGGLLKVGPASAGADPGPACYGRGNEAATVTDANVVLGTLNRTALLGGRMPIEAGLARAAVGRLAERLGLEHMAAAQGIVSIVTANMARAIRVISVQRGYDPRAYTLLAFGGAGPLHAARLARELDIPRVLVPRNPGILCALGLLLTDLRNDFSRTRRTVLDADAPAAVARVFADLETQAGAWFDREGIDDTARSVRRAVDMRYAGQNYELTVPVVQGLAGPTLGEALRSGFERLHERMYGYVASEEPIHAITFRLEAAAAIPRPAFPRHPPAAGSAEAAVVGRREVWLPEAGGLTLCPILDRDRLGPGHVVRGPAIVEQMDSTTLVLPGQFARVDPWLNLLIEG